MKSITTVNSYGDKEYRNEDGKLHREDGPAITYVNGNKQWRKNGRLHREDGPAIELGNGHKEWYQNDQLHREDGHAIEHADGSKVWFLNGEELSEEEFNVKMNIQPTVESDDDVLRIIVNSELSDSEKVKVLKKILK